VREAAATIPAEVSARFETAAKLSDEDKKTIIEIARQALVPFLPKPEPKPAVKTETTPKPDSQATPEAKAPTKPKVPAPPPAAAKPSATVESKAQP
jgi:F-type H+-transporting ATPase subunit alpha